MSAASDRPMMNSAAQSRPAFLAPGEHVDAGHTRMSGRTAAWTSYACVFSIFVRVDIAQLFALPFASIHG